MARQRESAQEKRPQTLREWLRLLLRDLAILGLIIAIVFGGLFAYAGVWPPMVVVESSSMQHSDQESFVGVIDTGDYVLVQAAPLRGHIVTWVEGRAQGYKTYGDFGDVIIFRPPPRPLDTPIIHRAIIWVQWNATGGWDALSLLALPRADWDTPNGEAHSITGSITLHRAGFGGDLDVVISLPSTATGESGFITMGDRNAYRGGGPESYIVPLGNVIGRARGELPWFGLLKLTIAPENYCCRSWGDPRAPANSWTALTITLVLVVVAPLAADFGLSWWQKRRKATDDSAMNAPETSSPASPSDEGDESPP